MVSLAPLNSRDPIYFLANASNRIALMTPNISGADAVVAWFGEWPTFHDAEVLTVHIDRELKRSFVRVRAFTRSNRTTRMATFCENVMLLLCSSSRESV